ncbi:MAG: response regulator [Anaerolineae bacterium]
MRILIADGDASVRSALRFFVAHRYDDVEVVEAATVDGVRDAIARQPVDVILLDWSLPPDGAQGILRALQTPDRDCRILVLSGRPEAARAALDAGADAFVSKGDPPEALQAALSRAIAGPDQKGPSTRPPPPRPPRTPAQTQGRLADQTREAPARRSCSQPAGPY